MALEDLNPAVRVEEILDGADIEPATRLEYFMKKAANEVPKPAGSSDAGKVVTVNEDGDGFKLAPASGGGGFHVLKATGAGSFDGSNVTVPLGISYDDFSAFFTEEGFTPVYIFAPDPDIHQSPYWTYDLHGGFVALANNPVNTQQFSFGQYLVTLDFDENDNAVLIYPIAGGD